MSALILAAALGAVFAGDLLEVRGLVIGGAIVFALPVLVLAFTEEARS